MDSIELLLRSVSFLSSKVNDQIWCVFFVIYRSAMFYTHFRLHLDEQKLAGVGKEFLHTSLSTMLSATPTGDDDLVMQGHGLAKATLVREFPKTIIKPSLTLLK